jgi:DNA repair protein RecN (Recombination protein N)
MLTQLQIRDFAIVESVEIAFEPGFTALTGETGAGKSILVDALLLAIGGRGDSTAIRHGAERAQVTASFDVARNAAAREWLEQQSIDALDECLLRRMVSADGRSRAWINGQSMPLASLRELGELLVDVHGQLEFQSLSRRGYQRDLLDSSGGLGAELAAVRNACREWRSLEAERLAVEERSHDREARLELLAHYLAELDALDPKEHEADELLQERRRASSLGRLAEGAAQLQVLLGQDGEGVADALGRSQALLRQLVPLDPGLGDAQRLVEEAAIACREALAGLGRFADTLNADPARLEWLESRLSAFEATARKHRVEVGALPALRERLAAELAELSDAGVHLAGLDRRRSEALELYRSAAGELSSGRRGAALRLDRRVTELMQGLGMKGGHFATRIDAPEPMPTTEHGADAIEFQVSANPGQPLRPLARVASGGELSRMSLALQVATLDTDRLPCLVFDEVDAGVGGAVAEMVGRQLRALSRSGQVLCVTHLAQVAAQADHQFRVVKQTASGETRTSLEPLAAGARVEEIARMLGGARITERTRDHAREMLEAAKGPRAGKGPARRPISGANGKGSSRVRNGRAGSTSGR